VRPAEIQDLVLLEPDEAMRRHLEGRNYGRARLLWLILLPISLAGLIDGISRHLVLRIILAAASLLTLAALAALRRRAVFRRNFPTLLFALLGIEILLWMLMAASEGLAIAFGIAFVSLTLLLLRLRGIEHLALVGVTVGAALLRNLLLPRLPGEVPMSTGGLLAVTLAVTLAAAIGWSATLRNRQEFVVDWRRASSRERERLRMRDELRDARTMQLAMLPAGAPELPGLDIAGVCVPATEVGGDYYGFFPATDGSLAVAIGDVAGHGMAAGLVLAGVRAGLLLLADEAASSPARVLERLNAVVRGIGTQRLLMTLGLARFDRAAGHASWVSAGHPPPLRFDAPTQRCEVPPTAHPPLGTRLPVLLQVVERPLSPGDVWLLVSDGALEARDSRMREFGEDALARAFARLAASDSSAGAILDALLAELSRFRGGHPQEDDLTLVVVRVTELA
jgi:hypothetical protein